MKRQSSLEMMNVNIPTPSTTESDQKKVEACEIRNGNRMWNFIKSQNWTIIGRLNVKDSKIMIDKEDQRSFHSAMSSILVMAQCFGILPVRGVRNCVPHKLKFKYFSAQVAYTCLFLLILSLTASFSVGYFFVNIERDGTRVFRNLRTAIWGGIFYGNAFLSITLFLKLASKWPSMMKKWHEMEETLKDWVFPSLRRRFCIITVVILITALCDQILHTFVSIPEYFSSYEDKRNNPCPNDVNFKVDVSSPNIKEIFQVYSCRTHWFIFESIRYDECIGGVLFVSSKLALFVWNFTDIFIILISIGLSERFLQFNDRIRNSVKEKTEEKEWKAIREHYNMLSRLVKRVDEEISGIVLLSFANNLCCLGLQIMKTLSDDSSTIERIYFSLSFAILTARTIFVTLSAARVHEESKDSVPYLYSCQSDTYCREVERLQTQMTTDEIALTGFRIFSITRSFILVVAGCIFTYVVVLLQFYVAIQDMKKTMMEEKMNAENTTEIISTPLLQL